MRPPEKFDPTSLLGLKHQLVTPYRRADEEPHDPERNQPLVLALIEAFGSTTPWLAEVVIRLRVHVWADETGRVALALPGRDVLLDLDDVAAAFAERLLIAGILEAPVPTIETLADKAARALPPSGGLH